MIEQALRPATLRDLKTGLHGELICPHDDGYDAARKVWNGMIDKYPALIVRCADQTDVINSIRFAQSQRLPVAMRSGGHSLAGISVCDGSLVIDLSPMKGVIIDPNRRRARVQAGLTLGEFVQATQTFGLATTTGTVAGTGLAGLTLGGGLGWFMGKYGLTIDNLLSVDLVTADGQTLRASETSHPDLFWAVRGGGGNFGVATSFEFQLHPVGPLLAGKLVYPMTKAREVLRFYREYTSTAPDELTAYASLSTTPTGLPVIALNPATTRRRARLKTSATKPSRRLSSLARGARRRFHRSCSSMSTAPPAACLRPRPPLRSVASPTSSASWPRGMPAQRTAPISISPGPAHAGRRWSH